MARSVAATSRGEQALGLILQKLEQEQEHREQLEAELRNMRESMLLLTTAVTKSSVSDTVGRVLQAGSIDDLRQLKARKSLSSRNLDCESSDELEHTYPPTKHSRNATSGRDPRVQNVQRPTAHHRHAKSVGAPAGRRQPRPPAQPPPAHIVARHEMAKLQNQSLHPSMQATESDMEIQRLRALRNHLESSVVDAHTTPNPTSTTGTRGAANRARAPGTLHVRVDRGQRHEQASRMARRPRQVAVSPIRVPRNARNSISQNASMRTPSAATHPTRALNAPRSGAMVAAVSRNRGLQVRPPGKQLPPLRPPPKTETLTGIASDDDASSTDWTESDRVQHARAASHRKATQLRQTVKRPMPKPTRVSAARSRHVATDEFETTSLQRGQRSQSRDTAPKPPLPRPTVVASFAPGSPLPGTKKFAHAVEQARSIQISTPSDDAVVAYSEYALRKA